VNFLPSLYGTVQQSYHLAVGGTEADAAPGTEVTLDITGQALPAAIPVDVLFLLDVTGSMGDEIGRLKSTIDQVAAQLSALPQQPDLHLAMTLFRDEGDAFVTSTFDFTADVAAFRAALADVVADGGGDTPEAVEEGLAAALGEPSWRDPATTVQMVFLVGDAAPHTERPLDQPWTASVKEAARRGITINSIAASNTDDPAEHAFRSIAEAAGGKFVFLSYGADGAAVGTNTDITKTDYEEMSLADPVRVGRPRTCHAGPPASSYAVHGVDLSRQPRPGRVTACTSGWVASSHSGPTSRSTPSSRSSRARTARPASSRSPGTSRRRSCRRCTTTGSATSAGG
jgi:Mg-chelatase subunit ChlD